MNEGKSGEVIEAVLLVGISATGLGEMCINAGGARIE